MQFEYEPSAIIDKNGETIIINSEITRLRCFADCHFAKGALVFSHGSLTRFLKTIQAEDRSYLQRIESTGVDLFKAKLRELNTKLHQDFATQYNNWLFETETIIFGKFDVIKGPLLGAFHLRGIGVHSRCLSIDVYRGCVSSFVFFAQPFAEAYLRTVLVMSRFK